MISGNCEISNLDFRSLAVEQDVVWLEISMNYLGVVMQISNSCCNLPE
jgi:hypothetical protein